MLVSFSAAASAAVTWPHAWSVAWSHSCWAYSHSWSWSHSCRANSSWPPARVNWCAHHVLCSFCVVMSRCYNRMLAVNVNDWMDVRLFYWKERIVVTALCRAYDWLHLIISRHLVCRHHLVPTPLSLLHHLHSPPPSITCHKDRYRRASD